MPTPEQERKQDGEKVLAWGFHARAPHQRKRGRRAVLRAEQRQVEDRLRQILPPGSHGPQVGQGQQIHRAPGTDQSQRLAVYQLGGRDGRDQQGYQGPALALPGKGIGAQDHGDHRPRGRDRPGQHVDDLGIVQQAQLLVADQQQGEDREHGAERQQPAESTLVLQQGTAFFAGNLGGRAHTASSSPAFSLPMVSCR
jgi:hypothetical protein